MEVGIGIAIFIVLGIIIGGVIIAEALLKIFCAIVGAALIGGLIGFCILKKPRITLISLGILIAAAAIGIPTYKAWVNKAQKNSEVRIYAVTDDCSLMYNSEEQNIPKGNAIVLSKDYSTTPCHTDVASYVVEE